jgi:hypothetical protein
MKKIFLFLLLTTTLTVKALSPNEMLIMIGAVKYYNENCAGLNTAGYRKMNQGLDSWLFVLLDEVFSLNNKA